MCGICGILKFDSSASVDPGAIRAMADSIRHRGPDDEGYHIAGPIGLGFRRLSIIDLSTGHQPLSNEDETVWIVFNGEIYNFQELRADLLKRGHIFKTKTDTEVIVHLYEEFGPDCLEKLRGMFGFALWDKRTDTLLLARDRVGIKPLYYALTDKSLIFASEIKAILTNPVDRQIAPELIDRFLTFLYVPGEETLLKGIRKLAPGHYLLVKNGQITIRQYWDLQFAESFEEKSAGQAEEELLALLAETVGLHMRISSFTVGFSGERVADERPYARLAAEKFGTDHHEITITPEDFAAFLPGYVWYMEEPVCEPPAIALYYVSKLARKHVAVLLSGEGGDEAFAGYSNYRNLLWLERMKRGGPLLNAAFRRYIPLMSERFPDYYYSRTSNPHLTTCNGLGTVYSAEFQSAIDRERSVEPLRTLQARMRGKDTLHTMLYIDTKTWLPDDLLIKADKMTMANSIELRVPLLDHKVLEFAASLPPQQKINGRNTKYILKRALSQKIPDQIRNRKKAGFPVPYASWIRRELKGLVRDVLLDSKTCERGYFRKDAVEKLLAENSSGRDFSKEIFSLLCLELWQRTFIEGERVVL
jgi:asparagine synthase (glutamine-hydrolysing)